MLLKLILMLFLMKLPINHVDSRMLRLSKLALVPFAINELSGHDKVSAVLSQPLSWPQVVPLPQH